MNKKNPDIFKGFSLRMGGYLSGLLRLDAYVFDFMGMLLLGPLLSRGSSIRRAFIKFSA
jgi:hypothetical protein